MSNFDKYINKVNKKKVINENLFRHTDAIGRKEISSDKDLSSNAKRLAREINRILSKSNETEVEPFQIILFLTKQLRPGVISGLLKEESLSELIKNEPLEELDEDI